MDNSTGMEAPVSWTVRYHTADGFDAMLTLRGATGAEVLAKADAALRWLSEHGAHPDGCKGQPTARPPLGQAIAPPAPAMAVIPARAEQALSTPRKGSAEGPAAVEPVPDPAWCAVHSVMMTRHEKDGKGWYSHKVGGQWCRGKEAQ